MTEPTTKPLRAATHTTFRGCLKAGRRYMSVRQTPTHTTIRGCLKGVLFCHGCLASPTHTTIRGCLKGVFSKSLRCQ